MAIFVTIIAVNAAISCYTCQNDGRNSAGNQLGCEDPGRLGEYAQDCALAGQDRCMKIVGPGSEYPLNTILFFHPFLCVFSGWFFVVCYFFGGVQWSVVVSSLNFFPSLLHRPNPPNLCRDRGSGDGQLQRQRRCPHLHLFQQPLQRRPSRPSNNHCLLTFACFSSRLSASLDVFSIKPKKIFCISCASAHKKASYLSVSFFSPTNPSEQNQNDAKPKKQSFSRWQIPLMYSNCHWICIIMIFFRFFLKTNKRTKFNKITQNFTEFYKIKKILQNLQNLTKFNKISQT